MFFPTRFFWVQGSGAAVQQTGSAAAADERLQGSGCVLVGRYVISTLELLVAEDYMIVYLNGATPRRRMPGFSWLKKCYQMIDRRWCFASTLYVSFPLVLSRSCALAAAKLSSRSEPGNIFHKRQKWKQKSWCSMKKKDTVSYYNGPGGPWRSIRPGTHTLWLLLMVFFSLLLIKYFVWKRARNVWRSKTFSFDLKLSLHISLKV